MKIYLAVATLLVGGSTDKHTDRQTGDFISLHSFLEIRLETTSYVYQRTFSITVFLSFTVKFHYYTGLYGKAQYIPYYVPLFPSAIELPFVIIMIINRSGKSTPYIYIAILHIFWPVFLLTKYL
jgi:hypothetical protein